MDHHSSSESRNCQKTHRVKSGAQKTLIYYQEFEPYIKSPEKITRQMDFGNALDGKTAPCGSQNPSSALVPAGAGHPLDLTKKYQSRWRGLFRSLTPAGAVFFPYFHKGNYRIVCLLKQSSQRGLFSVLKSSWRGLFSLIP